MKKTLALVLVLLAVLSCDAFAGTLDCQQSFELGKSNAKEEHKVLGWYFLGLASGLLAYGTVLLLDSDGEGPGGAGGLATIPLFIAPFVPALVFPTRNNITPYSSGGDLECYRDGYKQRAALKNCGAVFMGELTSHAVAFVVGMFIVGPYIFSGGW